LAAVGRWLAAHTHIGRVIFALVITRRKGPYIIEIKVHRGAKKIAARISEIFDEEFPEERVYQWRDTGKIRTFNIGPNICIRDDILIEDLTGQRVA
jgi:hypothetical protein